jgi:hypothetical protein
LHAYLITPQRELLELGLSHFGNQAPNSAALVPSEYQFFKNKKIFKVVSGFTFYFALERDEIPPLEEWDNARVLAFMEQIDLSEYCNIIKYQNVTGKHLLKLDKTFFQETIGMLR